MIRRFAVLSVVALTALAACDSGSLTETTETVVPAVPARYIEYDIGMLQTAMDSGEISARQLVEFYLDRIAAVDQSGPELRAIIEINPDAFSIAEALDRERQAQGPRGPLHGIPVVLKANIDTGDQMATTAGSLALADHHAPDDAYFVSRLRDAGAIILAKTNLSEWANFRSKRSSSGWSSIGGQTRNPYDPARNPCGSSSGSAVAVAANLTTLAVGTETDGSIVCPSGMNGIVGIKPTVGLVSRDGIIPIAHSQDTPGPMARTVRDAALMLEVMYSPDALGPAAANGQADQARYAEGLDPAALKGKRIGVFRGHFGAGDNPHVEAVFSDAIELLRINGADIVDPVEIASTGLNDAEYQVLLYEFKNDLNDYLADSNAPLKTLQDVIAFNTRNADSVMPFFGQDILKRAQEMGPLSEEAYRQALVTSRTTARTGIDTALSQHKLDAILAVTNDPAWMTDHVNGDFFSLASSSLAAVSGYPSITVPAGQVSGLPIGVSFFGGAWSEGGLIEIAYAFEQASQARRPPSASE